MSHDETRHVECKPSSHVEQERDQQCVSYGLLDEVFTYEQAQEHVRTARKVPDYLRDDAKYENKRDDSGTNEDKKESAAGSASEIVSNVTNQIRFTSTEELHEKIPIYSEHLLDIWRSNNNRQAGQERSSSQNSGLAQTSLSSSSLKFGQESLGLEEESCSRKGLENVVLGGETLRKNIGVENVSHVEKLPSFNSSNEYVDTAQHITELTRAQHNTSDYFNSKVLNNNLKLLKSKHEESQMNKQFDCASTLLQIKKLYNQSSHQKDGLPKDVGKPSSVSGDPQRTPSISFEKTFTNLIQGCNYFENKRLIDAAFRKTDYKNNPGAFSDESEPNSISSSCDNENTSTDGCEKNNGNIDTLEEKPVQNVNNSTRLRTTADNQNYTLVQISDIGPNADEQIKDKCVDTNSQRNQNETRSKSKHVTNNDRSRSSENWDSQASRSEPWKNLQASSPKSLNNLQEKNVGHTQVPDTNRSNEVAGSNNDEFNFSEDGADHSGHSSQCNSNIDEEGFDNITAEELLESLQMSQSGEAVHESTGEQPDCLFHLTNDGTLGFQNIRLRVMLPALNKVLCSNRVSQMTRTYHDIEAVTRLLEEKEKDLELTARIGKELLATNQKLENTVASLENELRSANESITQLHYELSQKNELLTVLTNDADQSEDDSDPGNTSGSACGTMQYEVLQRKIGFLERENRSLRDETDSLCAATDQVEAAEQRLVEDLAAQLSYAHSEVGMIEEDLNRTRNELSALKSQNQALADKLATTEDKLAEATQNSTEMSLVVQLARETQCELAQELAEMKEKYAEVLSILAETQDLLKRTKKRSMPGTSLSFHSGGGGAGSILGSGAPHPDSLAAELECSLFSEFSLDSGIGGERIPRYRRVFDTVRCSTLSSGLTTPHTAPSLYYESLGSSITTPSQPTHPLSYPGECPKGIPGIPGSADLEAALRRLTPGAVLARRTALSSGLMGAGTEYECPRTPDSVMSTGSSGHFTSHSNQWRIPEKLQIIKPMEGSATLQHWSALATPSLSNILEERPGVKVRGSAMDLPPRTYTLDDVEEDDDVSHPGKQFQTSHHTFTYTNSTVKHPDDFTQVTPSSMLNSRMSTAVNSRCSSRAPSRRNSLCMSSGASPLPAPGPSVSLSLAKVLHEKGIQAATPSTLVTPNYTPTATPCNSPERSRESSPTRETAGSSPGGLGSNSSSSSSMYSPFGLPGYLVASGAELLRRALVAPLARDSGRRRAPLPPPVASTGTGRALVGSNKALSNMSIVEQLERIGLDNIVGYGPEAPPPRSSPPPARSRQGSEARSTRVRADLGTVPFKGPSIGTLGAMRKGGLL
uniref:Trafficking kinesin-binding protein milt n=1 Tax=Cacopsylla melanoneura TaxID=428564 RepID=A0A8D8XED9_9HEMI